MISDWEIALRLLIAARLGRNEFLHGIAPVDYYTEAYADNAAGQCPLWVNRRHECVV